MGKRRRRGGRGFRVGKYVNIGFKFMGLAVAASPAINGVMSQKDNPAQIPSSILYNYTGYDTNNPGGGIAFPVLTGGVAAIIGGIVLAKLGGFLGRRF